MADEKTSENEPENKAVNPSQKADANPFNPSDKDKLIAAKKKIMFRRIMKLFVVLLGIVIVAAVLTSVIMTFAAQNDELGSLSLNIKRGELNINNAGKAKALQGSIGKGFVGGKLYIHRITSNSLYYEWLNTANLRIEKDNKFEKCYKFKWSPRESGLRSFEDCFSLESQHFYGGSELYNQSWPLNKASISMKTYQPMDTILGISRNQTLYGPVLERYWVTSNGIAIVVDDSMPLHVSFNDNNQTPQICLKSDPQGYPGGLVNLTYRLCMASDIKAMHQYVMGKLFNMPKSTPDQRMISQPIWSTWAMYGKNITQRDVMDYAQKIQKYNFSCSQIEIDDMYMSAYGDYDFDVTKFPNASAMIDALHSKGYRVSLWVHPFANTNSKAFLNNIDDWVKSKDPQVPGLVRWWNGIAGVLDTTNEKAVESFTSRLKTFQSKYKIDGFKFDAGSLSYLPKDYKLNNSTINNPTCYSSNYAKLASKFGGLVEARVGYRTQDLPIFIRILDRSSIWGHFNGLKSVIPAVLTLGILGYPFVLPDMVGGNGMDFSTGVSFAQKPDKELYIRWVQVNTFLPAMQFSIAPWVYDNETVSIVKRFIDLRNKISPVLIQAAKDVSVLNASIVRPLWWLAPTDETSLTIDSEYIVGDTYLVAPVLDPVAVHKGLHKVYFPPGGKWKKEFGDTQDIIDTSTGGKWITFNVKLEDLPYFSFVKDV